MKRYIDADLLKTEICKNKIMSRELITQRILHIIDNQPTADVAEVMHGKWIDEIGAVDTVGGMRMTIVTGYKCSVCGHSEIEKYPFCNCGAKMDKE